MMMMTLMTTTTTMMVMTMMMMMPMMLLMMIMVMMTMPLIFSGVIPTLDGTVAAQPIGDSPPENYHNLTYTLASGGNLQKAPPIADYNVSPITFNVSPVNVSLRFTVSPFHFVSPFHRFTMYVDRNVDDDHHHCPVSTMIIITALEGLGRSSSHGYL